MIYIVPVSPFYLWFHRACSSVGSESDCRSRDHELNPGPINTFFEIDHEIISSVILLLQLIQEVLLLVTSERIAQCTGQ